MFLRLLCLFTSVSIDGFPDLLYFLVIAFREDASINEKINVTESIMKGLCLFQQIFFRDSPGGQARDVSVCEQADVVNKRLHYSNLMLVTRFEFGTPHS